MNAYTVTMTDNDNNQDVLDVRDIIARVEELREMKEDMAASEDDDEELRTLETLLAELAGYGGDEQWEGDWYPVTLIRDTYFEEAMDEMLEDIGTLPKDLPGYLTITVDYDALKMDYSEVDYDGVSYFYR